MLSADVILAVDPMGEPSPAGDVIESVTEAWAVWNVAWAQIGPPDVQTPGTAVCPTGCSGPCVEDPTSVHAPLMNGTLPASPLGLFANPVDYECVARDDETIHNIILLTSRPGAVQENEVQMFNDMLDLGEGGETRFHLVCDDCDEDTLGLLADLARDRGGIIASRDAIGIEGVLTGAAYPRVSCNFVLPDGDDPEAVELEISLPTVFGDMVPRFMTRVGGVLDCNNDPPGEMGEPQLQWFSQGGGVGSMCPVSCFVAQLEQADDVQIQSFVCG